MKVHLFVWALAILSTGLMAGLFFTWSNAVMPGIGKMDNTAFLGALKSMNKVILNPLFFLVFFGSVVLTLLTPFLAFKVVSKKVFTVLLVAGVVYLAGMFLVTVFGNIPLNRSLENSMLDQLTTEQLQDMREKIEAPWKRLNWIRTVSSLVAFLLLLISGYLQFNSE